MEESFREPAINRLLLLHLVNETTRRYYLSGKVKLLKMLFEAQRRMINAGIDALRYSFYKWKYGPLSNEALSDLDWLQENGFLSWGPNGIEMTGLGKNLLEEAGDVLRRNAKVLGQLNSVITEFGPRTGRAAKEVVYDSLIPGTEKRVREADQSESLLAPLPREKTREGFLIDDEELENLLIEFDQEAVSSIRRGLEDIAAGRVKPYQRLR